MMRNHVRRTQGQTTVALGVVNLIKGMLALVQGRNPPYILAPFLRSLIDGKESRHVIELAPVLGKGPQGQILKIKRTAVGLGSGHHQALELIGNGPQEFPPLIDAGPFILRLVRHDVSVINDHDIRVIPFVLFADFGNGGIKAGAGQITR